MIYQLRQPGKLQSSTLYHINLLKSWEEPAAYPSLSASVFGPANLRGRSQLGPATRPQRTVQSPGHVLQAPRADPRATTLHQDPAWHDHLPVALPGPKGM